MGLMGPSLQSLFEMCDKSFSLRRLQFIHSKGILHRDIKPDNIVTGVNGNEVKTYLIGFGLARNAKYTERFRIARSHASCRFESYTLPWKDLLLEEVKKKKYDLSSYVTLTNLVDYFGFLLVLNFAKKQDYDLHIDYGTSQRARVRIGCKF
ncbi:kinase-like domain-containing protein [Zychaea mexicana]|uniref:kinase-like domain-containing protein n=1 Tax=Zychaea mexicana TaxID=64656 RepID=UPI0022FEF388|nr:kinase-like domain-containing protein [Zychaea mexicana]KAI9494223.1 kinase-like domain-containing protein [Zychaea mexicana]